MDHEPAHTVRIEEFMARKFLDYFSLVIRGRYLFDGLYSSYGPWTSDTGRIEEFTVRELYLISY